jgi:hypothetical protein
MFGGYYDGIYETFATEQERTFKRQLTEAENLAAKIIKANKDKADRFGLSLTVQPGLFGAVITGNLGGNIRRMTLYWPFRKDDLNPIATSVRNIADVLRLTKA